METAILQRLLEQQDAAYAAFQRKLLPTVAPERIIGVRTPALRAMAKQLAGAPECQAFLQALPHAWFEENQLHSFVLCEMKEFPACVAAVEAFLPWVDNWATCDQLSPKVFKKHREALLPHIRRWIHSGETYTVRFGIGMLMQHFLDEKFDPAYAELVAGIRSEEYYVNMEIAWYFATALAKQWDAVIPVLEQRRLARWVHNKTIQKARESFRITAEQKAYLSTLKRT